MEIFSELNTKKNLSLVLGYFDGVHTGHRAVIRAAVDFAGMHGTKSAVITFKDHPCCFFYKVLPKYILSRSERRKKIAELGIDYLYELDFGKIAHLSAEEYLKEILIKNFAPAAISTGFNHNFGADKSGNSEYLGKMSESYNYVYFKLDERKLNGKTISSTAIRHLISLGEIEMANKMLGYNFSIEGEVVTGQQLGRKLGFKTANLIYPAEIIELPFGAYSTLITFEGQTYKGVTNFGIRPTLSNINTPVIEAHLLNFDKDIYGKKIRVEFLKMIRPEKKFNSVEELKKQISEDISSIVI